MGALLLLLLVLTGYGFLLWWALDAEKRAERLTDERDALFDRIHGIGDDEEVPADA